MFVCCRCVSAGASKDLVDFLGAMVLEQDRKWWGAGNCAQIGLTLI